MLDTIKFIGIKSQAHVLTFYDLSFYSISLEGFHALPLFYYVLPDRIKLLFGIVYYHDLGVAKEGVYGVVHI